MGRKVRSASPLGAWRLEPQSDAAKKRAAGEQAYREAHAAAKLAGLSGEEMHDAGVKAQTKFAFKPKEN